MADYQARFGVRRTALVANRGLISEKNLSDVSAAGFDHLLATRLHGDQDTEAALEKAKGRGVRWIGIDEAGCAATEVHHDGRRLILASPVRRVRDDARHGEAGVDVDYLLP